MARLPRLVVAGVAHVVIQRGHNAQLLFADDADRRAYLASLRVASRAAQVAVHAYGLLPGEARLLVTPADVHGLARMMQATGRDYARHFNRRRGSTGTPWEGRFGSAPIDAAEHFLDAARWVEGGEPAPDAPVGSSAAHHLGQVVDPLVTEHSRFWALGNTPFEREVAWRQLLETPPDERREARLRSAALRGWALGSPEFLRQLDQQANRRSAPLPRGRPRRTVTSI